MKIFKLACFLFVALATVNSAQARITNVTYRGETTLYDFTGLFGKITDESGVEVNYVADYRIDDSQPHISQSASQPGRLTLRSGQLLGTGGSFLTGKLTINSHTEYFTGADWTILEQYSPVFGLTGLNNGAAESAMFASGYSNRVLYNDLYSLNNVITASLDFHGPLHYVTKSDDLNFFSYFAINEYQYAEKIFTIEAFSSLLKISSVDISTIPEPSLWYLMTLSLGIVGMAMRRNARSVSA